MIREALAEYAETVARTFEAREQTVGASDVGRCARAVYFEKNEGDPAFGAPRNPDSRRQLGRASARDHLRAARLGACLAGDVRRAPAVCRRASRKRSRSGSCQRHPRCADRRLRGRRAGAARRSRYRRRRLAHRRVQDHRPARQARRAAARPRFSGAGAARPDPCADPAPAGTRRHQLHRRLASGIVTYEFPIRRDPAVFETAQRRAQQILTARSAAALAPEGWIAGGRECERCPFSRACGNMRAAVPAQAGKPSAQLTAEVVALAREAKRHEAELDAATAAFRSTQNEIKERLRAGQRAPRRRRRRHASHGRRSRAALHGTGPRSATRPPPPGSI